MAYVGALDQLEQEGYEFASVSTCSAATFVGALYCSWVAEAQELFRGWTNGRSSDAPAKHLIGGLHLGLFDRRDLAPGSVDGLGD